MQEEEKKNKKENKEKEKVKKEQKQSRKKYGGVAQLGEHLLCKQGVRSSILLISTIKLGA